MPRTGRAIALVAALLGCLGAVAYAAVPSHSHHGAAKAKHAARRGLPRPRLKQHPDAVAVSTGARFSFTAHGHRPRFQCKLDGGRWRACRSPFVVNGLAAGTHRFAVRTHGRGRAHGRATVFRWQVLAPKDFSISPELSSLAQLFPGAPAQALPVTIANPNPAPIFITDLTVAATSDPPGCASAANLVLSPAGISPAAPLRVPPHGSVRLPATGVGAPSIGLRDLPVNQDACQGASFPLSFSGSARG